MNNSGANESNPRLMHICPLTFSRPSITRSCARGARDRVPPSSSRAELLFIINHCNSSFNKVIHLQPKCSETEAASSPRAPRPQILTPTHQGPDPGTTLVDRTTPTKFKFQNCEYLPFILLFFFVVLTHTLSLLLFSRNIDIILSINMKIFSIIFNLL
jgi:hypothetical protein